MPMSGNPNATTKYWLDGDGEKPLDQRPVFLIRFMDRMEHARVEELADLAYAQPSTKEGNAQTYKQLCEAVGIGVVGWNGMVDKDGAEVAFDAAKIPELLQRIRLTERELWELVRRYPVSVRLAGEDVFTSASPEQSTGDASAKSAQDQAGA